MERDFKNLNVIQERQYNEALDQAKETWQRQKRITDYLSDRYNVLEIYEVGDYQVAKVYRKKTDDKEIMYVTFFEYKPLHEMTMSLDQAILVCMSRKYEGHVSDFPVFAGRMLNAKFEPEYLDE